MEIKLRKDEYKKNGIPYCRQCNQPRAVNIGLNGDYWVRCICECEKREFERQQEEERKFRRLKAFKERQRLSMIGSKYLEARFDTAIITDNNKAVYESCQNYVKNAQTILEKGIGVYIYGDNSSGKTHLTACMCNELVEQGYSCVYTSVPKILAEIQSSYKKSFAMTEAEITNTLANKSFLFIDDLGKEFIGRENNQATAKFAERVLLEIVNARYNNGLPIIFSSNYSISDLISKFDIDKAIVERINEMSTKVLKLNGDNFRDKTLEERTKLAQELGI